MSLLLKAQFTEILQQYYLENYGANEADIWYEQPAVNVRVFGREGKIVTLKSHVLTGAVTEQTEEM